VDCLDHQVTETTVIAQLAVMRRGTLFVCLDITACFETIQHAKRPPSRIRGLVASYPKNLSPYAPSPHPVVVAIVSRQQVDQEIDRTFIIEPENMIHLRHHQRSSPRSVQTIDKDRILAQLPQRTGDYQTAAFIRLILKHLTQEGNRFRIAQNPCAVNDVSSSDCGALAPAPT